MTNIFALLTAFSIGISIFPVLIKIFTKFNYSDTPGGRKIHLNEVPSMGGIAFFIAALLSILIWNWPLSPLSYRFLIGGILLVFFVGLRDDMVELRASRKLLGQLIAVIMVVVAADIRIKDLHGFLGIGELPQLLNVIYGNMSLVGPRPHILVQNDQYSEEIEGYRNRHLVKPGLTGLAQAKGYRGETQVPNSMYFRYKLDMYYIKNWDPFFDVKIIGMTIKSIFTDNGNAH